MKWKAQKGEVEKKMKKKMKKKENKKYNYKTMKYALFMKNTQAEFATFYL